MKKIWCLFSEANDYNQPKNNLEGWWQEKPDEEQLADSAGLDLKYPGTKEKIEQLLNGQIIQDRYNYAYRLEQINEGNITNQ